MRVNVNILSQNSVGFDNLTWKQSKREAVNWIIFSDVFFFSTGVDHTRTWVFSMSTACSVVKHSEQQRTITRNRCKYRLKWTLAFQWAITWVCFKSVAAVAQEIQSQRYRNWFPSFVRGPRVLCHPIDRWEWISAGRSSSSLLKESLCVALRNDNRILLCAFNSQFVFTWRVFFLNISFGFRLSHVIAFNYREESLDVCNNCCCIRLWCRLHLSFRLITISFPFVLHPGHAITHFTSPHRDEVYYFSIRVQINLAVELSP